MSKIKNLLETVLTAISDEDCATIAKMNKKDYGVFCARVKSITESCYKSKIDQEKFIAQLK